MDAKSSERCLKRLKKEKPDLILVDVQMPSEDGWEILKEIKKTEKTKDIPVAMFTIRASYDSIKKSLDYGVDAHINKLFKIEELTGTVKKLLGKSASYQMSNDLNRLQQNFKKPENRVLKN